MTTMDHQGVVDPDSVLARVEELIFDIAPLADRDAVLEQTCAFLCSLDGVVRSGVMTTIDGVESVWVVQNGAPPTRLDLFGAFIPPHHSARTGERLICRFDNPPLAPEGTDPEVWARSMADRTSESDVDLITLPLRGTQNLIGATWVIGDRQQGLARGYIDALEVLGSVVAMTLEKLTLVDEAARQLDEMTAVHQKLQASNNDFQNFAEMASRDLQDPLRKIITFGDRLEKTAVGQLAERELDYLDRIHSASDRMQRLINDLLTFSSVHTADVSHEMVDLELVMADVLSDLEVAIAESGASVKIGELPTVSGSPTQLRQLLQNLVGNAIKFRAEGVEPRIIVGLANTTSTVYEVTVSDNGIGFDGKFLDKIFRPFQRLHGVAEYSGSGIGLSVCKRIAVRHGGKLTAYSKAGEGATFVVHLPVPARATPAPSHPTAITPALIEGQS